MWFTLGEISRTIMENPNEKRGFCSPEVEYFVLLVYSRALTNNEPNWLELCVVMSSLKVLVFFKPMKLSATISKDL